MPSLSEHEEATLRQLWTEGHATAEIGRRMGRSKNSIVGHAHRMDLPPRPSPIIREMAVYVQRRAIVKELRRQGWSYVQIAERLKLTMSQVETALHPARGTPRPSRAIRSGPTTLAPLPALVTPEPPQDALQSAGEPAEEPMVRKAPEPVQRPPRPAASGKTCQWPQEPWRRPWPMCGAAVVSAVRNGQVVELPYCRQCAQRAFHGVVFAAA